MACVMTCQQTRHKINRPTDIPWIVKTKIHQTSLKNNALQGEKWIQVAVAIFLVDGLIWTHLKLISKTCIYVVSMWNCLGRQAPADAEYNANVLLHGLHDAKNKIVAGFSLVFSTTGKGPFQTCKAFG